MYLLIISPNNMSFAGSIQMIFFPMPLTCTIGFQGARGPNKMAAAYFPWLHFLRNRSSIQSFFWRPVGTSSHLTGNPLIFFFHIVVFLVKS